MSFPFVAGVVTAQLAGRGTGLAAASCLSIAILLIICAISRKRCLPPLLLLFFALGAFCSWTEAIAGRPAPAAPFSGALDSLEAAIRNAGFWGENSPAIITALLTGRRSGLPRSTVDAFRSSGASHILALSGLHLGIIYLFLCRLLGWLGNAPPARLLRSVAVIAACAFYALLTGAGPSITRAFLFIVINEISRALSGRRHSPLATFSIALTVQLAVHPSLVASAGFQLSYLAMLGITVLFPVLESWYPAGHRADPVRRIWSAAALSISCQLSTAPAAWWHFRSLPRYFLITNLLALPLAEAIIVLALVTLLLGAAGICPPILPRVCGMAVELLEFCLKAISSL